MKLPDPRTMLLLDGLGGVGTAIMLCGVLPIFHTAIGLSPRMLVTLGLFGVAYGAYSLSCWKFVTTQWRRALTIIMTANVFYCVVSAAVVVTHRSSLTMLGIAYFVGEIALILVLVAMEGAVRRRCAS